MFFRRTPAWGPAPRARPAARHHVSPAHRAQERELVSFRVIQGDHEKLVTHYYIYGHLWPDSDERIRTAIDAVFDRPLARTVDGDAGTAAETGL